MSPCEGKHDKIKEAVRRLLELDAEAVQTRASCKVIVEVTYQRGKPTRVEDHRRRYERGGQNH